MSEDATPLAIVEGEPLAELPHGLYVPPDSLEVVLEQFRGPLDLLLYLIRKQNLDIRNLPVAQITRQYIEYLELMQQLKMDLAAEYLLMSAYLTELKSRILLPRPPTDPDELEEDPRQALAERLEAYARLQEAAMRLGEHPQLGRDFGLPWVDEPPGSTPPEQLPQATPFQLADTLVGLLLRQGLRRQLRIVRQRLSVQAAMNRILERLRSGLRVAFPALLSREQGRLGVVVGLVALLELVKNGLVDMHQEKPFSTLEVSAGRAHHADND